MIAPNRLPIRQTDTARRSSRLAGSRGSDDVTSASIMPASIAQRSRCPAGNAGEVLFRSRDTTRNFLAGEGTSRGAGIFGLKRPVGADLPLDARHLCGGPRLHATAGKGTRPHHVASQQGSQSQRKDISCFYNSSAHDLIRLGGHLQRAAFLEGTTSVKPVMIAKGLRRDANL